MWGYAQFSPDGSSLFYSTLSYAGIWRLDLATRTVTGITTDEGTGFGFSVSPDGKQIAYRRTIRGAKWSDRKQEIMLRNLNDNTSTTVASSRSVSNPEFHDQVLSYVVGTELKTPPPKTAGVSLQGIFDQKIVLIVNGAQKTVDPLGNGSYIWPSLSPDGSLLLAYDMGVGAIVSTVDGKLTQKLGRAEAPVWTRDGKWVVYFSETNDGYRITGGDLHAVRPDGTGSTTLTSTTDRVELFPSCSPTENKIVCHTMDGKLVLLTYTVDQ